MKTYYRVYRTVTRLILFTCMILFANKAGAPELRAVIPSPTMPTIINGQKVEMHALLIILGNDRKVRDSVQPSKEPIEKMLKRISYHCRIYVTIMESKDVDEGEIFHTTFGDDKQGRSKTTKQGIIRSEQIVEWLENLNPNPEDIVLVYYIGHGEIGTSALLFDSGRNGNDTLDRKMLSQKLEQKPARLRMLITDSDGLMEGKTGTPPDSMDGPAPTDPEPKLRLNGMVNLFFGHTGFLDINAASPGQMAWGDAVRGGYFTDTLVSQVCWTVRDVNEDYFISWEEVFAAVASEMELTPQGVRQQTPKAYSLPTPARP